MDTRIRIIPIDMREKLFFGRLRTQSQYFRIHSYFGACTMLIPVSYTHLDVYKRQIIESGTHEQLLAQKGAYYKLYTHQ